MTCNPELASNSTYGRYAVLSEPVTVRDVMADADNFQNDFTEHGMGDSAPNAFIDSVHQEKGTYLYAIFNGNPGNLKGCLNVSYPGTDGGLKIARAKLNGGSARLEFMKWYGPNVAYGNPVGSFKLTSSAPSQVPIPAVCPTNIAVNRTNRGLGEGAGGLASPLFPLDPNGSPGTDSFEHCQANGRGAAWFYSTLDSTQYDLSRQDKWSPPQEIEGLCILPGRTYRQPGQPQVYDSPVQHPLVEWRKCRSLPLNVS